MFTWGEGFQGKLGLGFKPSLKICPDIQFPMEVTRGAFNNEEDEEIEPVLYAGCGKQISVVLKKDGMPYIMGKFKFH